MRILVSIDDTDNIDSRGTGELATIIAGDLEKNGWGSSSSVSRHQLLVHPDIPYTSHNSAMCFTAEIDESNLLKIIGYASSFLARESAVGSDPGLCVAVIDQLIDPEGLQQFGRKAKQVVLTKEEAYQVARLGGIHLSEHGGTGQGVIGALAGAGLRLGGNDGRMRGQLRIDAPGGTISVADLCNREEIDAVQTLDGRNLAGDELVRLGEKVKTVLRNGQAILLVAADEKEPDTRPWQTCSRQQLRNF